MTEAALERLTQLGARSLVFRVAREHAVLPSDVLGAVRWPRVVSARHELWSLLDGTYGLGPSELSRIVGVDRTTIMAALKNRERRLRA